MNYWNMTENYGRIARWLHWGTALLFLLAYVAVYYRHWFTEKQTPENIVALDLHLFAGISVGHCCPVNPLSLRDDPRDGGGRTKFEPESRGLG